MSLHIIATQLQTALNAKGCPLEVILGPEDTTTATWGRERLVLEHDDKGGESFSGPRGLHSNAQHRRTRAAAYKATIYAQSHEPGAKEFEHRARVEQMLESFIASMDLVAANIVHRSLGWEPKSGGLFVPPDLAKTEVQGGAAYELRFTFDVPIRVISFAGAAVAEGTLAGLSSTTKVSRTGTPDPDPNTPPLSSETACGA